MSNNINQYIGSFPREIREALDTYVHRFHENEFTRVTNIIPSDWRKGVTAPADSTVGTQPIIAALRFNSTAEIISLHELTSPDWDHKTAELHIVFSLVNTQTAGDTLSGTLDYNAPQYGAGQGPLRAHTTLTQEVDVTAVGGLVAGSLYELEFVIDENDVNNPLADAIGLSFEFHLTNTDEVAEIDLISACILYNSLY